MCTITTQQKAKRAKEDIQCFKFVIMKQSDGGNKTLFLSPYQKYELLINKLDKAKLTFQQETEGFFTPTDQREMDFFYVERGQLKNEIKGKVQSIECGFHACLNSERIENGVNSCERVIVKCIIPKGSLVFYGSEGLIVSNKMIVTDEIVLRYTQLSIF